MRNGYTQTALHGGVQRTYTFPNGYGASVIRHSGSYGNEKGLWELAVLDAEGKITRKTPITKDVIGWLSETAVNALLANIERLPSKQAVAQAKTLDNMNKIAAAVRRRRLTDLEVAVTATAWIAANNHTDKFLAYLDEVDL